MFRVPRLVEGLRDPRVVRHDDRLRLPLGQRPLLEGPQVFSPLDVHPPLLQDPQGLVVRHPLERRLHGFQELDRATHSHDVLRTLLRDPLARMGDDAFRVLNHLIHARPRLLHFRVPVLREMPGRAGFLRTERRADVVDFFHREDERFRVELPGLRQVRLAAEVLHREEGRAALAARGRNHRR